MQAIGSRSQGTWSFMVDFVMLVLVLQEVTKVPQEVS